MKRRSVRPISLLFVAPTLLAIAGCPATADDLCAKGTCEPGASTTPAPGDAGSDGIVVAPRDNCVETPLKKECLDPSSALFVSRAADPSVADGSIARPYASIRTALEKVTDAKKRVYVCTGTYEEQVSIEKVPVTLIGGIACDFVNAGPKPKIAPPNGIALAIAAVGGASVLDVVVQASSDPNTKGSSAIGMFVTTAKDILLRRVEVTAGPGQPGVDGAPGTQNWSGAATAANGASGQTGGAAPVCGKCADGTTFSSAGQGGSSSGASVFPGDGSATPKVGTSNVGTNSATSPVGGKNGANGEARPAAKGASRPGVLMATSWNTEASAEPGPIGNPGQGGGGGGANASMGGGSGGCGGCGGGGGTPGGNGGSSIALLVFKSEIKIEDSRFTASDGGAGGRGGDGLDGQAPSIGGGGITAGGAGGYGAGGGGGGGGAGGHSAAIAHVGAAPVPDDKTVLAKAKPGARGEGGAPGKPADPSGNEGNRGSDGALGAAADVLPLDGAMTQN